MTPNAAKKGRSFKGVITYIIHDPDNAKTDERVLFTETRNLRTDDPEKAAKVMAYTAQHAGELKEAAGIKATGRKTDAPVYHLSLSWVPGEQPTQAEMMEAGVSALEKLGYGEHEAVFAAHGDKAHMHLHIVVNRINPETGKTHNPKDDQKILQAWGHEYDKARGMEHHSPDRAAKYEKDPEKQAEYQLMAGQAQEQKGAANSNSKPRAEWEAVAGATHPKSRNYQEIRTEYAERVKTLSGEGQEINQHHRAQWGELKTAQRDELKDLAQNFKETHKAEIRDFMQDLKEARSKFLDEENHRSRRMREDVHITAHTRVGSQGPEHRGNMTRLFNDQTAKHERAAEFWKQQTERKKEFFKELESKEIILQPEKPHQDGDMRTSFNSSSEAPPSHHEPSYRQQRAALLDHQRQERSILWQQQQAERSALQDRWGELNGDRAKAWETYREKRSEQESSKTEGRARGESRTADPGRSESSRSDPGRDSGRSEGGATGHGREFNGR